MKFLKDLWLQITRQKLIDTQHQEISRLTDELTKKETEIMELEGELDTEIENYNFMKEQFESMQDLKNKLLEELESYKKVEVPYTIPTDIIDTTAFPYLPNSLFYYWDGSKIQSVSKQFTPSKAYRLWTDEMYSYFKTAIKSCKSFDDKVVALRDAVLARVSYKSDVGVNNSSGKTFLGENWHLPTTSFYSQIGDCDSLTILWVTACNICGLPADRIFMGTGYYNKLGKEFGHAFGLAKFDDGSWSIIECTSKKSPRKFKTTTTYRIPVPGFINGLNNWAISGKAKKERF